MMDELQRLADAYRDAASHEWADGTRRHWYFPGAPQIYAWMTAVNARVAALEAELQPEGPFALQAAQRKVDELEGRLKAQQEGELPW